MYIENFKVYFSESQLDQVEAINWMGTYLDIEDRSSFKRYVVRPDYIQSRDVYAKGVSSLPYIGEALYSLSDDTSPTMNNRSEHAQEKIEEIFHTLYKDENEAPDHLNHVTCTHYQSPSAAQKMVVSKEWFNTTSVTHLYHMGCYAALPAIRISKAYIADGARKVDVVHTELCSFHLDKKNTTAEQVVMNTLFADGAIKYSVTSDDYFQLKKQDGLEMISQREIIIPGSENEMTWKLGSHGFLMTLSRNVPIILAKVIEKYIREIFYDAGLDFDKDKDEVIFAIHPGGPKIIELIEKVLKLTKDQVKHSKRILKMRGNMSSATVPYIWNEILEDQEIKSNTYIATVAFGPGLTLTGALLKLCRH